MRITTHQFKAGSSGYCEHLEDGQYCRGAVQFHLSDDIVDDRRVPFEGEAEVPAETFALLKRQLGKLSHCPCGMCSDCIEVLTGDVIPIVDSLIERRALSTASASDTPITDNDLVLADRQFIAGAYFGWNCATEAAIATEPSLMTHGLIDAPDDAAAPANNKFRVAIESRLREIQSAKNAPARQAANQPSQRPASGAEDDHSHSDSPYLSRAGE